VRNTSVKSIISIHTILALLLSLIISACSSTPEQPQWLDEPPLEYPAERYLSAVGEASNREVAANRARANLSHVFQVAIKDVRVDFSEAVVTTRDGNQQVDNNLRVSRFVRAGAAQVLEGTLIVDYWVDEQGKVFSLVVLEKAPASRRFRDSVRSADRKTADWVEYARTQAPNPVAALRALESARLSQLQRDNANRNLTVTAGKGINTRYSSSQLEVMIRQSLSKLQFSLNQDEGDISTEVENAMASLGIEQNPQSAYQLNSKLDTEPLQQKQGWIWLRGSVQMSLNYNGETIAKERWPFKVSALEEGMVIQRTKDSLNKNLSHYLYQMLTTPKGTN
jgi:LPP20 lipoprotein